MGEYADFDIDNGISDWGDEIFDGEEYMSIDEYEERLRDGEPCSHPGCFNHVTHPCEKCGRINGKKNVKQTTIESCIKK